MAAEQAERTGRAAELTVAGRVALLEEEVAELRAAVGSLSAREPSRGRAEDCGLKVTMAVTGRAVERIEERLGMVTDADGCPVTVAAPGGRGDRGLEWEAGLPGPGGISACQEECCVLRRRLRGGDVGQGGPAPYAGPPRRVSGNGWDSFVCCSSAMPQPLDGDDRTCPQCGLVWEREPGIGAGARIKTPVGWMGLWLLTRGRAEYDEVSAMVVASAFGDEARELAGEQAGVEGRAVWMAPALAACARIGEAERGMPAQVVIRDVIR